MVACLLTCPAARWARRRHSDGGVAIFVIVTPLITSGAAPVFKFFNDDRVLLGAYVDNPIVC